MHKKILGSRHNNISSTTLVIPDNEMEDLIKIVKSLKDSRLLLKGVTVIAQNEVKEPKGGSLSMLLGILSASLLANILAGEGINRTGEEILRAGYGHHSLNSSKNKKGQKKQKTKQNNKMDFKCCLIL